MARVKVLLEPGETQLDADHALQKALEHHSSGSAHDEEAFDDPAMVDLAGRLELEHSKMYANMVREISDVIDEEYSDGTE